MNKIIDLSSIDREQFDVRDRDGLTLITPKKSKHVWQNHELHLRSLLVRRATGEVVSSGFPKFRNYGEDAQDDADFRKALSEGKIVFTEKLDGTLIITDNIDGKAHFRTRGQFDLGDFEEPVMRLVKAKYPRLLEFLVKKEAICQRYSLLFEYTAPDNRIVIRYEEPELHLIGVVDKRTLLVEPNWGFLRLLSDNIGVPLVRTYVLPHDFNMLMATVKKWNDREGVVARIHTRGPIVGILPTVGAPYVKLLKIKTTQYLRLHAIKFRLDGKVGKLCFLLGVRTLEDARQKLFDMGIDYETQEHIWPEVEKYVHDLNDLERRWKNFVSVVHTSANWTRYDLTDPRAARKAFVEKIRLWLKIHPDFGQEWFTAAMLIFDGKKDDAWLDVVSNILLKESPRTVAQWRDNPMVEIEEMLHPPTTEGTNNGKAR